MKIEDRAVRFAALVASTWVAACGTDTTGANAGSTSPGKASIEFTVVGPDSYCAQSMCGEAPSIDIEDSSGHSLFTVTASCASVSCDTCKTSPCPGYACQIRGVPVSGATLDWDGSYNVTSSCGSGTSCVATAYASPGRYTAKMCATPGQITGPDGGGVQQCVASGQPKCGSVDFDFPSTTVVKGTVGP